MTPDIDGEKAPEPDIDEELAPSRTMGTRAPRKGSRHFTVLALLPANRSEQQIFTFAHTVLDRGGGGAKMSVFHLESPKSVHVQDLWAAMFTVKAGAVQHVLRELRNVAITVSMHSDPESARKAVTAYQNRRVSKELNRQGHAHGQAAREGTEAKEKKRKKADKAKVKRVRFWDA
ncbi:hypothetical protein [Microbacterium esteraromaticum]|uniref:hypothetical protein n=1 Tax=Microbacterium esteraromaticum TaxID=57043 RepID=UPI00195B7784|nr:hypothetical protein [Microbacterium esteraromaticum]MBM7466117.1 hypothetical protein [Microbacterium esteraromaticum]